MFAETSRSFEPDVVIASVESREIGTDVGDDEVKVRGFVWFLMLDSEVSVVVRSKSVENPSEHESTLGHVELAPRGKSKMMVADYRR